MSVHGRNCHADSVRRINRNRARRAVLALRSIAAEPTPVTTTPRRGILARLLALLGLA